MYDMLIGAGLTVILLAAGEVLLSLWLDTDDQD